jgi:hypothetical protein
MKRLLSALAATTALLLLVPAAAGANTYDVYSCWAGYGTFHNPNASSAAWTRDQSSSGGHFATGDLCGVDRGSGALSVVSLSGPTAAQGQNAELSVTAPMGTTFAGASLWRRAWSYGAGSGGSSQRNALTAMAGGTSYLSDADGTTDVPLGTRGTGDTTTHGINSGNLLILNLGSRSPTKFSYRVSCGFAAGCLTTSPSSPYPNNYASGVELFGSIVTIQDSTPPGLTVGNTGLFDGQEAAGVESVEIQSAGDSAGIKRVAVFADDAVVPIGVLDYDEDVNHCDWAQLAPCQNVAEVAIPVDTAQLPDGLHSFVVKAFDAADNERASTTHYVMVRNQGAPDPTPDPTPNPTPDPAPGDSGAPSDTGLPNGTVDGGTGGSVAESGPPKLSVSFESNGQARYAAKYNRMVVVRGVLSDGTGARIANAQVDYSAQSTTPRARVQNLGSVRTDSSGTFNLAVATKLGSRKLRFAYSPQIGGAPAASAEAQLNVIAPVSLKISPKHVRNGKSVTFRGRLSAGPIPHKGKLVNLQVRLYGHWHTFATVRTTKSGRFKYRYRFRRTYGYVVYRFRARSRYEAAYPFVAGSSHTVRVAVTSCPVGCD